MAKRRAVIHEETGRVFNTMSEAEREFGIPAGMLSEAIKLGKPVRGHVFHVLDANTEIKKEAPVISYPYVRAWAQYVHPDSEHFLAEYLKIAVEKNAPEDAVFWDETRWVLISEITNTSTLRWLDKIINKEKYEREAEEAKAKQDEDKRSEEKA